MSMMALSGTMAPTQADSAIARTIIGTERFIEMDRRQAYLDSTQHDLKRYDFDGRVIAPGGVRSLTPYLSGEKMPGMVPLKARRPCAPYRLGKIIINAFTNLVFGENRFPEIKVEGDEEAQDWNRALALALDLPTKMVQARNFGGAQGTVGMSWAIIDGNPRVRVHNTKNTRVVQWKDRDALIPSIVEEIRLYFRDEPDPAKDNKIVRNWYWFRRTWTENEDIVYQEIPAKSGQQPIWTPDPQRSDKHNDGECHFVWIQNDPSEEEDGISDLDGVWEQCDELDIVCSVVIRGAKLNLDPTLLLNVAPAALKSMGVKKGSEQALIVGEGGNASYLELAGTSITSGIELAKQMRQQILETAQCVVPDPDTIAAQGVSSVSIKALYSRMLARGAVLRTQYGVGMKRVLEGITRASRKRMSQAVIVKNPDGTTQPGRFVVHLPPRAEEIPDIDPTTGQPLGTSTVRMVPRSPGRGGEVDYVWPPWFPPTPDDINKTATGMQMATGGKAFVSKQTATEHFARALGTDPAQEWERVQGQAQVEQQAQAQMFQDAGGAVDDPNALPDGATPNGEEGGPPKGPPPKEEEGGGNKFGGGFGKKFGR